jgi:hypothetical protein
MAKRPAFPRINCCIEGCKRGTTTVEPGIRIICGKCWRRAPKETRASVTRWQKRSRQFAARGDLERAEMAGHRAHILFENIRKLLSGESEQTSGIDPLMAEGLRKAGLL